MALTVLEVSEDGEYLAYGAVALWVLGLLAVYGPASRAANIAPAIATRTA